MTLKAIGQTIVELRIRTDKVMGDLNRAEALVERRTRVMAKQSSRQALGVFDRFIRPVALVSAGLQAGRAFGEAFEEGLKWIASGNRTLGKSDIITNWLNRSVNAVSGGSAGLLQRIMGDSPSDELLNSVFPGTAAPTILRALDALQKPQLKQKLHELRDAASQEATAANRQLQLTMATRKEDQERLKIAYKLEDLSNRVSDEVAVERRLVSKLEFGHQRMTTAEKYRAQVAVLREMALQIANPSPSGLTFGVDTAAGKFTSGQTVTLDRERNAALDKLNEQMADARAILKSLGIE